MAEVTPTQQFIGTALAILIVGLILYGIILLIQWFAKRNGTSRIIERDSTARPVQTQTSARNIVSLGHIGTTAGVSQVGSGAGSSGARVVGGGNQ